VALSYSARTFLNQALNNFNLGARELCMARWGMPCPPQFGGPPATNTGARLGMQMHGSTPVDAGSLRRLLAP
jgi:hypothetical protein